MVRADERNVQTVVDYFKKYLEMANRGYRTDLENEARHQEEEKRRKLAQELAEAEQRAKVLKNLKI